MAYLDEAGYQTWNVSEWISNLAMHRISRPEKAVILTFDDGFADFYSNALPVLTTYQLRATLYITTGYVGATSRWLAREGEADRSMLSWEQIAEINASGIECGAHTIYHPSLDILSTGESRQEITESKSILEDHLKQEVNSFAYPYGHHDWRVRDQIQEAGYTSACAVKNAYSSLMDDPLALARITITHDVGVDELCDLLTRPRLRVAPFPEQIRTRLWRIVRRFRARMRKS